jgi:hypothetical protein
VHHGKNPKNRNTSGGVGQFDVILTDISNRKISVITVIRGATGRGHQASMIYPKYWKLPDPNAKDLSAW